ncbi:hypothetical protein N665_0062s0084 [Sinapis alba]|nr:hypothetical protein N665_0062s0084 [Sinapis alba]
MARRGRCSGGGINLRRLSRLMDSCSKDLTTAEDIVDHLRSTSREYARSSQNALLTNVRKILNARLKEEEEEEDNSGDQGKRKKQRRTNKERSDPSNILRFTRLEKTLHRYAFGANLETGFLLYGPPGCGKTLVAKAVANEAGANFIYIKGPEVLNKYVGESELAIRTLFQRARTCSPCILFFDEVDAMTTSRGREGGWVVERLLNQFLTELDGGERRNVYVIGATNRPDVIDSAFLRPGRFGNLVYVPLPTADERASILKAIGKKKPIDPSVDLDAIAKINCENFSGADLANLMDKAIHLAVEERFRSIELSEGGDVIGSSECTIKVTHIQQAVSLVSPSVNKQQIKHYEELPNKLQRSGRRNNNEQEPP